MNSVAQFVHDVLAFHCLTQCPRLLCVLLLCLLVPGVLNYLKLDLEHLNLFKVPGSNHSLYRQATIFSTAPQNCSSFLKSSPFPETSSCSPSMIELSRCFINQPPPFLGGPGLSSRRLSIPWSGNWSYELPPEFEETPVEI